jgi:hypothetical protein
MPREAALDGTASLRAAIDSNSAPDKPVSPEARVGVALLLVASYKGASIARSAQCRSGRPTSLAATSPAQFSWEVTVITERREDAVGHSPSSTQKARIAAVPICFKIPRRAYPMVCVSG